MFFGVQFNKDDCCFLHIFVCQKNCKQNVKRDRMTPNFFIVAHYFLKYFSKYYKIL